MSKRKLLPRNFPREVVHQIFFTSRETLNDSSLLPLKRFTFKDLRNAPAQEINTGLHVFLEGIGLPARQRQQSRPVSNLEIVDVAPVGGFLGARMQFTDHARDRAAAACAG